MLKTLQSRLLVSFFLVVVAALLVMTVALFGFATLSSVRYTPTLQRLAAISLSSRRQLMQLAEGGAGGEALRESLSRTAADTGVRVLITTSDDGRVVYDSETTNSWLGVSVSDVDRPRRLLPGLDGNTVFGRFRHPNGSNWLVYSQPLGDSRLARLQIFFAQREPTPGLFFREFFLPPLGFAGLVSLVLGVLLALLIARSVSRPLQQLAGAAEGIADGEYDHKLPLQGPDEVRRVAASFNRMARRVRQTQQSQRDFVANVSHDLKTPITSITGWSQALLDGTAGSPPEQEQAALIIHGEAGRMARLVSQLLDLARLESGQLDLHRQPVDMTQLVNEVHHSLKPRADEKGVYFTLAVQPTSPISGDPDRLTQVLHNLVDNALAHTPAGGRVHLALAPHAAGKVVEVTVQDTGMGIPAAELPRIFERFYQVDKSRSRDPERRSTGLGLAIVKELVEAHHGRIQANSEPGKGTIFTIRLPASGRPADTTISRRS